MRPEGSGAERGYDPQESATAAPPCPGERQEQSPCLWCKRDSRRAIALRADGVPVLECQHCSHRAVGATTMDLTAVYQDSSYFCHKGEASPEVGYSDYSAFSLADWTAEILSGLLLAEGAGNKQVLDIGCATGIALDLFQSFGLATFGIEPSPYARQRCREKGHRILSERLEEFKESEIRPGLVTAFHVIEHLEKPAQALEGLRPLLAAGGRLLAVFPNVDFSSPNWSGYSDSFEHISYFAPDFVATRFPAHLHGAVRVLYGPALIYCFAGDLDDRCLAALDLAAELIAAGEITDSQATLGKLAQCTATGALFITCFLARNHSAVLARKFVELLRDCGHLSPADRQAARALAAFHNGNMLGTACAIAAIESGAGSTHALARLLSAAVNDRAGCAGDSAYPLISVWICPGPGKGIHGSLLASLGEQTYPNIEVIVMVAEPSPPVAIPPALEKLVRTVDLSGLPGEDAWRKARENTRGRFVLWTDGSLTLSQYCLFALYEPLCQGRGAFAYAEIATAADSSLRFTGGRRLGRLLKRITVGIPPLLLFDIEKTSLSGILPTDIANRAARNRLLSPLAAGAAHCQDSLASRSGF